MLQLAMLETYSDKINTELRDFGLQVRGNAVALPNGALFLVGSVGDEFFQYFRASPEYATAENPLDQWSKRIIDNICDKLDNAEAIYPFDLPSPPFQSWAMASDEVSQSPMGILIHNSYGLWHAYRGAIKISNLQAESPPQNPFSPCDSCDDKPCLSACPVGAFESHKYDTKACFSHLDSGESQSCFGSACLARRACPVATEKAYAPEVSQFFMTSFYRTLQKIS